MASQVLSGSSNVSYTNNTGQNVRVIINFMASTGVDSGGTIISSMRISWAGNTVAADYIRAIGRNLAFHTGALTSSTFGTVSITANNMSASNLINQSPGTAGETVENALPTELMLAPGQTFSAICGAYNVIVIPEAG
jgi:hypothetical protein